MIFYLAAPIDLVGGLPDSWRTEAFAALEEAGAAWFDPARPYGNPRADAAGVLRMQEETIRASDGMLALLPDGVPSVGVPIEINYAASVGKPVAVVMQKYSMSIDALPARVFSEVRPAIAWLKSRPANQLRQMARNVMNHVNHLHVVPRVEEMRNEYIRVTAESEEYIPTKHYEGDAGFDLICSQTTNIPYQEFVDVPCGINVQLPPGVWAMITGRSSTLRKRHLLVSQGIIDNGYRGPIYAGVQNLGSRAAVVEEGERIAQLIPFPLTAQNLQFAYVDELDESDRGEAGFGSTGT